jgi:hypothetical protein
VDDTYHAWNNVDCNGHINKHFYTPKYFGSNVSSKLRSISGASNSVDTTRDTEITYAKANNLDSSNPIWYTEVYADWQLIFMLLFMMAKSTNVQTKYGYGRCGTGSAIRNGTMNGKGMFWGDTTQTNGVKVFGMENYWGNLWRACAGYMNLNNVIYTKLTYDTSDGSTVTGYNTTGNGYVSQGSVHGTDGGYISAMHYTSHGLTPKTARGSDSIYFPDGCWSSSETKYGLTGGDWAHTSLVGFCSNLSVSVSIESQTIGACLSCKPLA